MNTSSFLAGALFMVALIVVLIWAYTLWVDRPPPKRTKR